MLPLWYQSVRVPRAHLPYDEVRQLEDALAAKPLAAVLPSTVTVYVLCQGRPFRRACAASPTDWTHKPHTHNLSHHHTYIHGATHYCKHIFTTGTASTSA